MTVAYDTSSCPWATHILSKVSKLIQQTCIESLHTFCYSVNDYKLPHNLQQYRMYTFKVCMYLFILYLSPNNIYVIIYMYVCVENGCHWYNCQEIVPYTKLAQTLNHFTRYSVVLLYYFWNAPRRISLKWMIYTRFRHRFSGHWHIYQWGNNVSG